jgi:hypothetical protein
MAYLAKMYYARLERLSKPVIPATQEEVNGKTAV